MKHDRELTQEHRLSARQKNKQRPLVTISLELDTLTDSHLLEYLPLDFLLAIVAGVYSFGQILTTLIFEKYLRFLVRTKWISSLFKIENTNHEKWLTGDHKLDLNKINLTSLYLRNFSIFKICCRRKDDDFK